ncbi:MAG: twin-arginine translocase subunit TatC [bacterium]
MERADFTEARMSVWDHLDELRSTLIWSLSWWAGGTLFTAIFARRLFQWLLRPLHQVSADLTLHTFSPPEAFITYLKITLIGGFVLASPMVVFHLLQFVIPGLKPVEKKQVLPVVFSGFLLFAVGVLFAYYLVVPLALDFLWEFNQSWQLEPRWRLGYYLSFVMSLCLVFGAAFELPLVITVLARIGLASPAFLRHQRKYVVVGLFAASAIITPPDVITQVLLAVPMWLLYEISILMAWMVYPGDHASI